MKSSIFFLLLGTLIFPLTVQAQDALTGWNLGHKAVPRFIEPSLRVYFDSGHDDVGEIDLYNDGELLPSVTLFEIYKPFYKSESIFVGSSGQALPCSFGLTAGLGITAPAGDPETEAKKGAPEMQMTPSDAPVLLLTYGFLLEIATKDSDTTTSDGNRFGIEFGRATGLSADEGLDDFSDSAWYVGIRAVVKF